MRTKDSGVPPSRRPGEGHGVGAQGAHWTLGPNAVTSRSGGLRGWGHPLLRLSLTDVCPVHIGLDRQGIRCGYELMQPVAPS